jgi:ATP/maltotriose-dependent transcriptional regulator MalT
VIDAARRHYDAVGDRTGRIAADVLALELDFGAGRLTAMIDAGLRLADAATDAGDRAQAASTYARLVSTASWLGRGDLADEFADRAISMAGELGLSSTRRWASFFLARLAWMRGDLVAAERVTRELIEEGQQSSDRSIVLTANRLLGETLIEAGRLDEADVALAAAVAVSVDTGDRWSRTELHALRAQIRILRGEFDEARRLIEESLATLRTDDVAAVSVVDGVRGLLAARDGDDRVAEQALRRSMEVGQDTEYWWWAMPAVDLAEFLVSRGRIEEAASLVARVDGAMRQFGYGLRRARIDALLAAVAGQPA